jgi:hydrogenase maturation protease
MRTIVIGIGNPVLSDDSVGVQVARRLASQPIEREDVRITELYTGGLDLMEAMVGFDRAIVIDAMISPGGRPGTIYRLEESDWLQTRNSSSTHDASLAMALELGRMTGLHLPDRITAWAVEAQDVETIGEELTDEVSRAVPTLVRLLLQQMNEIGSARGVPA